MNEMQVLQESLLRTCNRRNYEDSFTLMCVHVVLATTLHINNLQMWQEKANILTICSVPKAIHEGEDEELQWLFIEGQLNESEILEIYSIIAFSFQRNPNEAHTLSNSFIEQSLHTQPMGKDFHLALLMCGHNLVMIIPELSVISFFATFIIKMFHSQNAF